MTKNSQFCLRQFQRSVSSSESVPLNRHCFPPINHFLILFILYYQCKINLLYKQLPKALNLEMISIFCEIFGGADWEQQTKLNRLKFNYESQITVWMYQGITQGVKYLEKSDHLKSREHTKWNILSGKFWYQWILKNCQARWTQNSWKESVVSPLLKRY